MKQIFKVRVRQYATGEIAALSHHEMEAESITIDDVVMNYTIGDDNGGDETFREFDVVLSATPPERGHHVSVSLDVPDGAQEASVDVPEAVPA